MKKILVTGGCSFTHSPDTYAVQIKQYEKDLTVHNISLSGAGNDLISRMIIHKISQLLKEGEHPDDIFVIMQLSGLERKSFLISEDVGEYDSLKQERGYDSHLPDHFEYKWGGRRPWNNFVDCSKTFWAQMMANGITDYEIFSNYFNYIYSDESHFVETLENILKVQWFLNQNNIQYKMFCGWDIFTYSDDAHLPGSFRKSHEHNQFMGINQHTDIQYQYTNINNQLYKDKYKNSTHLWDLIDFNNFWFCENENLKYGGLINWTQYNIPPGEWYRTQDDHHPSTSSHTKFTENIVLPWIKS
tara:strand:- start:4511 stop:5413 length:903 start_codon:yes stop_codon:yes gene_type:complete